MPDAVRCELMEHCQIALGAVFAVFAVFGPLLLSFDSVAIRYLDREQ